MRPSLRLVGAGPGLAAPQRTSGLRPARGDARVDRAGIGSRPCSRRVPSAGSAIRRAPRASMASAAPSATSGRSCGCRCTVMWRALSSTASSASAATRPTCAGSSCSSERTTWRASCTAVRATASATCASSASSSRPNPCKRLPNCEVSLRGEALLETLERDEAVAVAVLVAGLARCRDFGEPLLGGRLRRSAVAGEAARSGFARRGAAPFSECRCSRPRSRRSSSRGMNRA
jgi:hypothetical protein